MTAQTYGVDDPVSVDVTQLRHVMGHFATGVTIVTAMDGDEPVGFTCQSFTSLSIDPPLVSFCPSRTSTTWPRIRRSGIFCVNVLSADQDQLCRRFAVSGGSKFAESPWRPGSNGAPVLDEVHAWVAGTIEHEIPGGDHTIVIGRVTDVAVGTSGSPLLYYRSQTSRWSAPADASTIR